ncbi:Flp pilus assembly complex ATPase component TadA [Candidatus Woesearchaeota archaeon]|jgi:ATPase|nr:Flp pilus assembly complex ATPase component TadA [Candidatus Woesearchaeota archaeon]MBT7063026.1 Flp pilus assembly complex ATPase component TadA [Candidatus Woesearchaeota archaeon]MBT7402499.1 Flp pilus assembly complex ATPase component TadA [Candidatus Woesearchaeota archaeon]
MVSPTKRIRRKSRESLIKTNAKTTGITKLVPDTSAIINIVISKQFAKGKLKFKELILHNAMLSELENQANSGREIGFIGLDEIKRLRELANKKKFKLTFAGEQPTIEEIKFAKKGGIDSKIRKLAEDLKATMITSDMVQAEVGKATGMDVIHIPSGITEEDLTFPKLFKPDYMSVHLKEGALPRAKAGKPGAWKFIEIDKNILKSEELEAISDEIIEAARSLKNSFLEIERKGSLIAQVKQYRIVVTRPPLSNSWEITIVRPVKKLELKDYKLDIKIKARLLERAEGILISGAPGHGKSTFAQALAKVYSEKKKVVKSLEAPRDLQLPPEITQLSTAKASHQELKDILLLTRPDYTLYDEVRDAPDFKLFADMRLSGVGMVGVVHAANPIDAIQRFIGKVELGMIPHILDTVIFIKDGKVAKVFGLKMNVKCPTGMNDKDLARPVVDIYDFEDGTLEYEIYTFGDATVVMPVHNKAKNKSQAPLRYRLKESKKYFEFYFLDHARRADLTINGEVLATLPLSRSREIRIFKKSGLGKAILEALAKREEIKFE